MLMSKPAMEKYPKFAAYVKSKIPDAARSVSIVDAIQKIASPVSRKTILEALRWGNLPSVTVKLMVAKQTPEGRQVPHGGYTLKTNTLDISEVDVLWFQAGKGLVKTANGQSVQRVAVDLLHELTHWACEKGGVVNEPGGEAGFEFEKAVYGALVE